MNNLYNIGVEREGLRCNQEGELSDLPHPSVFGDKIKNHFIGTDFGEAQVEVCTPVCHSVRECYEKLSEITNVVLCELYNRKEVLWPYSMPCILPSDDKYIFNQEDFSDEIHQIIFGTIYNLHALGSKDISLAAIEDYKFYKFRSFFLG